MHTLDFSTLYRSAIGFDQLINLLEGGQNQNNGNYPSYNIELVTENQYRIAIAVAGFSESELEITSHDNLLIVKGVHTNNHDKHNYLYQGIAKCDFERKFQLAEHIKIKEAQLKNGLLFIDLERVVPENLKPRHIEIK